MRENKIVYLVEGECEMKFIRDLLINIRNKDGILLNGTVHKFNPYQEKNIRKIHRHLAKNKDVIFVLDNDVAINEHFKRNIKDILKISKNVYLLVQNDNFEDELMYMCKLSNTNS